MFETSDPEYRMAKAARSLEPCMNHRNCGNTRRGFDLTCLPCRGRRNQYGSPNCRPIFLKEWSAERRQVARVLKANTQHAAYIAAVAFLDTLKARSVDADRGDRDGTFSSAFKGAREVARLARAGVESSTIVEVVCGLSLYLQRAPLATDKERLYALSRAVLALAPRPVRTTWSATDNTQKKYRRKARPSDLHALGVLLAENLATVVALVALAVEEGARLKAARVAARRAPMVVPPARQRRPAAAAPA